MPLSKFDLSNQAVVDLEEIWLYTFKNWSLEQADFYLTSIEKSITLISAKPLLGKRYRQDVYYFKVTSHYIFYNNRSRKVLRVLHKNSDLPKHL